MPPKNRNDHPRHKAQSLPERNSEGNPAPKSKGWFQWVPSDMDQLAEAEAKMIAPVFRNPNCKQRMIAGINTVSFINPDGERAAPKKSTAEEFAAQEPATPSTFSDPEGDFSEERQASNQRFVINNKPQRQEQQNKKSAPPRAMANPFAKDGKEHLKGRAVAQDLSEALNLGYKTNKHYVKNDPSKNKKRRMILLVHGFAGGVGNWVRNWEALCSNTVGADVHMIDLPGFGRSVREKNIKFKDEQDVLSYYDEKLQQWLEELPEFEGLEKMEIDAMGHSFGSYLVASLACKRPDLFTRVVLADPWGVSRRDKESEKDIPLRFKFLRWVVFNTSPLSALRAAGPWGPNLLPKVRPDFAPRWQDVHEGDPYVFYDYTYLCNTAGHPTGELAFAACSHGFAAARAPLADVLPKSLPRHIDFNIVYGAQTWMSVDAGIEMVNELRATGMPHAGIYSLDKAGHQINSDNPVDFNLFVCDVLHLNAEKPHAHGVADLTVPPGDIPWHN